MPAEALAAPFPLALVTPLPWTQVRLGALLLLALYIILAVIFSQRELGFLSQLKQGQRRLFITLDLLIQLSVLLILLPCILAAKASLPVFVSILAGFVLLWVVVIWNGSARSMYTYRLMLEFRNRAALGVRDDSAKDKASPAAQAQGPEKMDD